MLGEHLSILDLNHTIQRLESTNCKTFQFFPRSPRDPNNNPKIFPKKISNRIKELNVSSYAHEPYLINLCRSIEVNRSKLKMSIKSLNNFENYNAVGYVFHIGSLVDKTCSIDNIYSNINYLLDNVNDDFNSTIMLENAAGEGRKVGGSIEDELIEIIDNFENDNIKICLDTAHAWGYGYKCINDIDIPVEYIELVHLNNSIADLGSRKDQHGNFDFSNQKNKISEKYVLKNIAWCVNNGIPMILETKPDTDASRDFDLDYVGANSP